MILRFTRAQLKVFSAVCSNFVVFWLGSMLTVRNNFILTLSLFFAIVSWDLAVRAEEILEEQ